MKLNIRGEKVTVTPAMKTYITEKLSKMDKYFENPEDINANVLVRIKGLEQIIEVTALTKRFTLRAEESNEDFYAAVDLVVAKLERQIRKNKERLNNKYKNVEKLEFNFSYDEEPDEEETNSSTIVKRKNISMKPMDEEEAMLQIELLNHDFFVFKNIDEECVSVLYKRKDGNYGIINMK
jgi:putative sigma-54 modulation protein